MPRGREARRPLKAAENLVTRAQDTLTSSGGDERGGFPREDQSKPEIWADFEKFVTIPGKLAAEEARPVAAIKSGDCRAAENQLAATGWKGCNACHGTYRMKSS